MTSRRQFLAAGVAATASSLAGGATRQDLVELDRSPPAPHGFELDLRPTRIFKRSGDQNRLRLDQWVFVLVLMAPGPKKPRIDRLVLRYASGDRVAQVTIHADAEVAAMDLLPVVPTTPARDAHPVAAFQLAGALAQALAIDRVTCEMRWRDDAGAAVSLVREFPIEAYVQKTALVFPFAGPGLITQGGAWNDGHRNRSGQFAIDAIGLTERYAPMLAAGDAPDAVAGWGREVIAPAAGEVVVARGDRPDQPVTGVSDPKYFVPEHPDGGDPGNHCVIDHGNGEFSMLAHFRHGSLRVRVGDRVEQGQVLGNLGNSGDSDTPHVHHQLQSGPEWTTADALPHVYRNGPGARHDRGVHFDAGPAEAG